MPGATLGNGCSLAAIQEDHGIDTTMGFTPLEDLMTVPALIRMTREFSPTCCAKADSKPRRLMMF